MGQSRQAGRTFAVAAALGIVMPIFFFLFKALLLVFIIDLYPTYRLLDKLSRHSFFFLFRLKEEIEIKAFCFFLLSFPLLLRYFYSCFSA